MRVHALGENLAAVFLFFSPLNLSLELTRVNYLCWIEVWRCGMFGRKEEREERGMGGRHEGEYFGGWGWGLWVLWVVG